MSLPSQTGRSSYHKSHMYRSKQAMNLKLIIGGLVLAVVVVVVWAILANREGAPVSPPAVATNGNEKSPETAAQGSGTNAAKTSDTVKPLTPKREDSAPRLVMGQDVTMSPGAQKTAPPAISTPQTQPQQQTPVNTARNDQPQETPNKPVAIETPRDTSPRAITQAERLLEEGIRQAGAGKLVEARQTLSMALEQLDPYGKDANIAREQLGKINDVLVFSNKIAPNDPFGKAHKIASGEYLSTIAKRYGTDWMFLARINNIKDPGRIQVGQTIKVIDGTFHALVRKSAFELDLYLGEGSDRVFVRSFSVGLGELDSTPVGRFAVLSRVSNPSWKNPRTGEYFAPDDPKNPIGDFWVGLKGIEPKTEGMNGYGIHGTIDPDSIGKMASMGCVRMMSDDIALVYELLTTSQNTIEIVP